MVRQSRFSWSRSRLRSRILRPRRGDYYRNPATYWDGRHRRFGDDLDGVGTAGLGESGNRRDYETKWEHLRSVLVSQGVEPDELLDAGCGIGWFTERLLAAGHRPTAIDFSPAAVELARRRLGPASSVEVASLADYHAGRTFPLVICIDVLFHVVDDDQWRVTVANLGAHVASNGLLVIQEHLVDEPAQVAGLAASHTRWRSEAMYRMVLDGWELLALDHYMLPCEGQTKDLMLFRRP